MRTVFQREVAKAFLFASIQGMKDPDHKRGLIEIN